MRALAKLLFGFCQVFGEIARFKGYIWWYLRDLFALVFLLQVIHSIGLFATTGDHLDPLFTLLIARLSGVALARFLYHLLALKTRLDTLLSVVSEWVVVQEIPLAELECVRVGIYRARVVARIGFEGGLDNVWGVNVFKVPVWDGALQTGRHFASVLVDWSVFQVYIRLQFGRYRRPIKTCSLDYFF